MLLLKEQKCEPCNGNEEPLKSEKIEKYLERLKNDWKVIDNKTIKYSFPFENFKRSMAFAQEVARIAENEDHHPDLCVHYKSVDVELSTHAIGGLSENDFIMAAKIDEL
ncbi:4a-hydroxytetrahydrobiopterin dehydratase [Maribellus maritimus]|uniref:4a-hydroxytetrahydrobiopterin dehydratase n=1 Tax=Maribellus maritimus TaxID=2870838 RepID=UPI001EEC46AF|nr:4a-hydroxytetrahydrobiopterin dehydratase [Maribellus maritimus]MCG6187095.1 4a-hydroxytetrahydrobiopterin dehydratase [Maribellus maritimus]